MFCTAPGSVLVRLKMILCLALCSLTSLTRRRTANSHGGVAGSASCSAHCSHTHACAHGYDASWYFTLCDDSTETRRIGYSLFLSSMLCDDLHEACMIGYSLFLCSILCDDCKDRIENSPLSDGMARQAPASVLLSESL